MRTIGIDLSLTNTGLVVYNGKKVKDAINIQTNNKDTDVVRIKYIARTCLRMAKKWEPTLVGIEAPTIHGPSISHTRLAELAGVVKYLLDRKEIPFELVNAMTLKKHATGSGKAKKEDMILAARINWPDCPNNDLADAYHIAVWAYDKAK